MSGPTEDPDAFERAQRWFAGAFDPRGRADLLEAAMRAMRAAPPVADAPGLRWREAAPSPFLRVAAAAAGADPAPMMTAAPAPDGGPALFAAGDATLFAPEFDQAFDPGFAPGFGQTLVPGFRPTDPARDAGTAPRAARDLRRLAALAAAGRLDEAEGVFAALMHDPRRPALTLLRDRWGHGPLWIARLAGGATLFASSPHMLLAAPGVSRTPDFAACALFLAARQPGPEHAYFADIAQAPPGAALRLGPEGESRRAVAPLGPDPALGGRPADEIAQAVAERARAATLARAPGSGPTAMMLSGGLDSALIAAHLAARGPVEAFASVLGPGADPALTDERAHQRALAHALPGLRLHETPAGDLDLLAPSAHWWRQAASPNPDVMHATQLLLAQAAADLGAHALFSGFGGDFALSSHGEPALFEFLVTGRWRALAPELARRRAAGGRWRNILLGGFVKPLPIYEAWRRLRPDAAARELPAILRTDPAIAARLAQTGCSAHLRYHRTVAAEEAAALAALPAWTGQAHDLPGGRRIAQRLPLLDARLLRAVLAAPVSLKLGRGPDGRWRNRALIRALLRPLVPPAIAEREDKDLFQPDFGRLMRAALPRIRADAPELARSEIWRALIDAERWRAALDEAGRAPDAALLSLAHPILLPWQLGDFLRRTGAP
ncbi:asparagine synthase-related protein [Oceanicella actignis]|uniref:asparagine synthase (glutamine-hydrolyzing) n=1 Tax=Oceanicella actignis TaxID=1189325 RepID=A0A1M7TYA2_9RHOB|nr:asparagine synthase-related protein [Oceanicella actignis]SET81303.1 Glutamine amidotransferase domain-containing protein [Oceanicella actignis]SHN75620.1 Glutamine amidotransferase domain-containing protein [Oceanicella actignis]